MTFLLILKSNTDSAELVSKNQHKEIKLNDVACELWLHELSYNKKIFQPGMVLAKLQLKRKEYPVDQKNIGIPTDIIVDHFKDNILKVTRDGKDVATDYYIYKVIPEFRRDSDANQYVELTCYCYSRDHKLTLNPYSKMYVNKKLVGDMSKSGKEGIMQAEMDGILKKAGFDDKTVDCSSLRFLKYITQPEKKDEKGNVTQHEERKEFIQPYLVQYNESFYDFLARTANRCGEFLYHDQGKLHLGLPITPNDKIRTIDEQTVYAYRYQSFVDPIIQPSPVYVEGSQLGGSQRGKGQFASGSDYFYYDELPIDEYLGMVLTKDGFSSFTKEESNMRRKHMEALSSLLTAPSLGAAIADIISSEATFAILANSNAGKKNADGNSKFIDTALSDQKDGDKVCLYGSMLNNDVQGYNYEHAQNLNTKFYQFVSKCSHNIAKTLIEVETGVDSPNYGLGEEVKFNGQNCIIIGVEEDLMSDRSEDVARGQRLVLAPKYTVPVDGNDTTLALYCPPPVVPFAREVGIQRAFVAKNGDPQDLGRVCIRYPWQQASDEPSPWIRMIAPFAPNDAPVDGAGIFFEPKVGDEVVVDYENGNIEHPIITGSLFSHRSSAPSGPRREVFGLKSGRDRVIMSEKGHSIMFTDSDMASHFLTGFYPGYKLLTTLVGAASGVDIHFGEDDSLSGGITLCDSWGMYRISASATDRNITIMSPYGDVRMSAFTGITISAPNGDVKIQGKNVSIEAGNEIKLISGKNISTSKSGTLLDTVAEAIVGIAEGAAGAVASLVDFSFIRTVYETFVKPVAGTLTIHSGRYLLLDAGGSSAEIPNKGLSLKGLKRLESDNADAVALSRTFPLIYKLVDQLLADYVNGYERVYSEYQKLRSLPAFETMTSPTKESVVNMGFNNTFVLKKDMTFDPKVLVHDNQIRDVHHSIGDIRLKVQSLYQTCNNFTNGTYLGQNENGKGYLTKAMKGAIKKSKSDLPKCILDILNKDEKFEDAPRTVQDMAEERKYLTRLLAVKLVEESKVLERSPLEVAKSPFLFSGKADYLDDATWNSYVNQLIPYNALSTVNLTTWEAIKKAVMASFPAALNVVNNGFWDGKWLSESQLWGSNKQGEILMCDKNGKETISIVNGVLTRSQNEDGFLENAKDVLLTF